MPDILTLAAVALLALLLGLQWRAIGWLADAFDEAETWRNA